jgi:flagellar motility protein MotE (MotC chaperone)
MTTELSKLQAEIKQLKKDIIRFPEWIEAEGWEQYDGFDRWINQKQNDKVVETYELYKLFKNGK